MIVALAVLMQLLLVPLAHATPVSPAVYYVVLDNTASLVPAEFAAYAEVFRRAVLELLRAKDSVVLIVLDPPPGLRPRVAELDGRRHRLLAAVQELDEAIRAVPLSKNQKGYTDLGKVFQQVGESIRLDRQARRSATLPNVRILVLTDGKMTGRQTNFAWKDVGEVDVKLAFVGIHEDTRASLGRLCATVGFPQDDRVLFVDVDHVSQSLSRLPDFFDRSVNQELHQELARIAARDAAGKDSR